MHGGQHTLVTTYWVVLHIANHVHPAQRAITGACNPAGDFSPMDRATLHFLEPTFQQVPVIGMQNGLKSLHGELSVLRKPQQQPQQRSRNDLQRFHVCCH